MHTGACVKHVWLRAHSLDQDCVVKIVLSVNLSHYLLMCLGKSSLKKHAVLKYSKIVLVAIYVL